jgi:LuxR family maltose regulon positive regulatory protein
LRIPVRAASLARGREPHCAGGTAPARHAQQGVPMATSAALRSVGMAAQPNAAASILNSKITVPRLPEWAVPRPRLDRLIGAGVDGPLTVLVGAPGSGKTLAMASWAAAGQISCPVAWVTLDEFDNRPPVLWSYVMAALRRAGVPVPPTSWAAAHVDTADHEFLVRLASALATADPPVLMILDDLHQLTDPTALQSLIYLLRNAQPGLHLMVASRMDPQLPLHRFRLAGELAEIRASDLAFSVPESGLLMTQHGIILPPGSLECLTERAEGWAAGLRLAAISMDGHPDPGQFVKEFVAEDSPVAGYLVEEVLNAQPPEIRELLLRTSILDTFNADIVNELTDDHGENALPDLVRTNAFVHPLGGGWYRYHALFGEVLRLKLRREMPGLVPGLHRRAAGWHLRHGSLAQAVRHAAKAGDWELAARMVVDEMAVSQLIEPGGNQRLSGEFARMPHDQAWTGPEPLLVAAALELTTDHPGDTVLSAAESALRRRPAQEAAAARLAAAQIRLAFSLRSGDLEPAAAEAARIEALLDAFPADLLVRRPWVRAQALSGRGTVEFWSGRLGEAAATFDAALAAIEVPDSTHERSGCLGYLALLAALRGRLNRAASLAAEAAATPSGDDDRLPAPISPAAHVALAAVHLERDEPRQVRSQLRQVEAALRLHPDRMAGTAARIVAARQALAAGHPDEAMEIIRQARHGWSPPYWLERRLALLASRACADAGDIRSAIEAAGRADPASLEAATALAHAWLAAGDPQSAGKVLASHREQAGAVPDQARLEAWLAAARLSYTTGDRAGGRRALQRALRLGEPERLRLPFVLERSWIRRVLRAEPDLAQVYRDLLGPGLVAPATQGDPQPGTGPMAPVVLEPLSSREREVLRRASEMLDTTEIAAALFISVNTVKSHLKSIYRKLAVTHRNEAVRRAQQLRIL